MTEIMPFPENNIILFYWTAPQGVVFSLAERVGFEPTVGFPITSFQDWLLKPLGHLSIRPKLYHLRKEKSRVLEIKAF